MDLLEWTLVPKRPGTRGEDRVVIGARYLAVIDGASNPDQRRDDGESGGESGGALVADALAEALGNLPALPMRVLVEALSAAVQAALDASAFAGRPRAAASAVIYAREARRLLAVGDCGFSLGGRVERPLKPVDALLTGLRSFSTALPRDALPLSDAVLEAAGGDAGRAAILPFLRAQHHLQNQPGRWGFGVFDGQPVRPEHITEVAVPPGAEVILFSDGYPAPGHCLAEAEALLQAALRDDPACLQGNAGTKGWAGPPARSYDDRAYLRFRA